MSKFAVIGVRDVLTWITDTVLTIHGKPRYHYPEVEKRPPDDEEKWRKKELSYMRSNTLKILFTELSDKPSKMASYQEMTSIRQPLQAMLEKGRMADGTVPEKVTRQIGQEGASSLFYYLFEDYAAAITILNESKPHLDGLVCHAPRLPWYRNIWLTIKTA